jgi:hypothetical protein
VRQLGRVQRLRAGGLPGGSVAGLGGGGGGGACGLPLLAILQRIVQQRSRLSSRKPSSVSHAF